MFVLISRLNTKNLLAIDVEKQNVVELSSKTFYNEIKKCCLLKETNEISVYIGFADKEKYIIREAITKEAMFRMEAVISN